jgi:hypothetical protein
MTDETRPDARTANRKDYASDLVSEDGTRIIVKTDGTVVSIRNGETTVQLPPERLAAREARERQAEKSSKNPPVPQRPKPPEYSHLPIAERPLNVGSAGAELIAIEMSNFENAPFVLDGRRFESVEGFYVWLKWSGNPEKQALAQKLSSYEAKAFGKASKNTTAGYEGVAIPLGGPEHHALIRRAIRAKLEQHPDIARRFAETHPRPIIHDLGGPEPPSRLPALDFARLLTELRQDLVDGTIETIAGPVSRLSELAREKEAQTPSWPVSQLLNAVETGPLGGAHPIRRYIATFPSFSKHVTALLAVGAHSLIFEMPGNLVLKITNRSFSGWRPLQCMLHVIEHGKLDAGDGLEVHWYTQPKAALSVTEAQVVEFRAELARQAVTLADAREHQLGVYNGAVKALDPFAVRKLARSSEPAASRPSLNLLSGPGL